MPFNPKNGECLCHRCGKFWIAKADQNKQFSEPKSCAGCKSKVWNQPRKYNLGTLESSLIVVRREKLTGRAAKKAKELVVETKQVYYVEPSRLFDDGDIGGSVNVEKLVDSQKIGQPFEFNGEFWIGTGACGTGTGKGWASVDAHKVVKANEFVGTTYTYRESMSLPNNHPHRWNYHGLRVKHKKEDYVLSLPKVTFKPAYITGYHGCKCHPFTSWEECRKTEKQQFQKGDKVKHRCYAKEGVIEKSLGNDYWSVKFGTRGVASDYEMEHAANLIKLETQNGK